MPLKKLHWPPDYSSWSKYHQFQWRIPRTWHGCSWQEEISCSYFRVGGIQNSPSWERVIIRFPLKCVPFPLSSQRLHPETVFRGRGNIKANTLCKAEGLGKSEAKLKDTMLRANTGNRLKTGRGLSSAFEIDCHSQAACQCWMLGLLSLLETRPGACQRLVIGSFLSTPWFRLPLFHIPFSYCLSEGLDGQSIGGGGWSSPYVVH